MQLVRPSVEYKSSFLEAVNEYRAEEKSDKHNRDEHYKSLDMQELENNFDSYVNKELAKEMGEGLPKGWVPDSVFWLVDNGEFIGRINVRHRLTEELEKLGGHIGYDIRPSKRGRGYGKEMLKLALIEAKKIGIENVLITCNFDNAPSRKVIESNGGKFQDQVGTKNRYFIDLK